MKKITAVICLAFAFMLAFASPAALAAELEGGELYAGNGRHQKNSWGGNSRKQRNSRKSYRGTSGQDDWRSNHSGFEGVHNWGQDEFAAAVTFGLVPEAFAALSMDEPITRQEFCYVALLLFESFAEPVGFEGSGGVFSDCDDPTVMDAYHLGIISGYSDSSFRPDSQITRQELVKMLYNVLSALEKEPLVTDSYAAVALKNYSDNSKVQGWAVKATCVMLDTEITNGMADGSLAPEGTATREQAIIMAYRFSRAYTRGEFDDLVLDYTSGAYKNRDYFYGGNSERSAERQRANAEYEAKYTQIFGSLDTPLYKSDAEAKANMVTIQIPVWTISDGAKVASTRWLTVHRNIADTVAAIFDEIFAGTEKFPIYSVGGYSWRSNENSEHRWGVAIDINPNENYMIKADGTITCGSFWNPAQSVYSIPVDGDVTRAFANHGFTWGGTAWRSSNDYMHFSFFGR